MTLGTFSQIMFACNDLMNKQFSILGFSFSLWQFILFDVVIFLVLSAIVRIFGGE